MANNLKPLFIDTSALIALLNPRDQNHSRAKKFLEFQEGSLSGVSSNLILGELLTFFSRYGHLKNAILFQQNLFSDSYFTILWAESSYHFLACQFLEKFADKKLSYTDAVSFAMMQKNKIYRAFTFDEDFLHAGFEMVPNYK